MGKHTKEPWVLFEVGDRHVHFCPASEADKTSILTVTEEDGVSFAAVYSADDARRIVAFVNACEGMSNEELEGGILLGVMEKRIATLEQQRTELISVLEELFKIGDVGHCEIAAVDGNVDFEPWEERAKAAIAKAKGGAA